MRTAIFALVSLVASAAAQSVVIAAPAPSTTLSLGSSFVVDVERPVRRHCLPSSWTSQTLTIPLLRAGLPHELPGGLRRHRVTVLPRVVLGHQRDQQHRHLAVRRALRPHVRGRREPRRRAELHGAGPGPLPDWARAAVCGALLADPGPCICARCVLGAAEALNG